MVPKENKGKVEKVPNADTEALAEASNHQVVFDPVLTESDLVKRYAFMWGKEMKAQSASHVLPGSTKSNTSKYRFFVAYFYCGFCPPLSNFFNGITHTYGFYLLDFMPNAITYMSVFAHL